MGTPPFLAIHPLHIIVVGALALIFTKEQHLEQGTRTASWRWPSHHSSCLRFLMLLLLLLLAPIPDLDLRRASKVWSGSGGRLLVVGGGCRRCSVTAAGTARGYRTGR
uniref:Uncharacterized protein n=1 Tax=Anopheles darlingi TaxID=43151 RepID=A0A2M4DBV3_ANODA